MPTQSTLSSDDKSKVKSAVPNSSNKIQTAALARIYYAHPDPNKWSYAGLQGAIVFLKDNSKVRTRLALPYSGEGALLTCILSLNFDICYVGWSMVLANGRLGGHPRRDLGA